MQVCIAYHHAFTVAVRTRSRSGLPVICMHILVFTISLFPAPIKLLRTSLPGELRLAPHTPTPGWQVF